MRTILGSLLLLGTLCSYAADDITINVDPSKPQFVVKLPANPTTGYQWSVVKYDKSFLKMTNKHFIAPTTKLVGAGGVMTFTFALLKGKTYPKTTQMFFSYARSWDASSASSQRVTIYFNK